MISVLLQENPAWPYSPWWSMNGSRTGRTQLCAKGGMNTITTKWDLLKTSLIGPALYSPKSKIRWDQSFFLPKTLLVCSCDLTEFEFKFSHDFSSWCSRMWLPHSPTHTTWGLSGEPCTLQSTIWSVFTPRRWSRTGAAPLSKTSTSQVWKSYVVTSLKHKQSQTKAFIVSFRPRCVQLRNSRCSSWRTPLRLHSVGSHRLYWSASPEKEAEEEKSQRAGPAGQEEAAVRTALIPCRTVRKFNTDFLRWNIDELGILHWLMSTRMLILYV